ncbi:MAG: hypothetical protein Q9218_007552 [Villophora microphyllina]
MADAWLNFVRVTLAAASVSTVQYTTANILLVKNTSLASFAPGRGLPSACLVLSDAPNQSNAFVFNTSSNPAGAACYLQKDLDGQATYNGLQNSSELHDSASKAPSEYKFEATTFGSSTRCRVITDVCDIRGYKASPSDHVWANIHYDCKLDKAGLNLTGHFSHAKALEYSSYFYNDSTMSKHHVPLPANPILWYAVVFTVGQELVPDLGILKAIEENSYMSSRYNTTITPFWGLVTSGSLRKLGGILSCTTSLFDVKYSLIDLAVAHDAWKLMNRTAAYPFVGASFWSNGTGNTQYVRGFAEAVAGAKTKEDIASGFATTCDHNILSLAAGMLPSRPPLSMVRSSTAQVTRIPQAPFIALIVLDLVYAAFATGLMVAALMALRTGHNLRDAQARLSTLAVVAESFESPSWGDDAKGIDVLFAERRGEKTRRIALVDRDSGGRRFKPII